MASGAAFDTQTCVKAPDEILTLNFDFSHQPEFEVLGVAISAVDSVTQSPIGLTIGANAYSGSSANVVISGGTVGGHHRLKMLVTLTTGTKLAGFGYVTVAEPEIPS